MGPNSENELRSLQVQSRRCNHANSERSHLVSKRATLVQSEDPESLSIGLKCRVLKHHTELLVFYWGMSLLCDFMLVFGLSDS